jgi:hypothetical protein
MIIIVPILLCLVLFFIGLKIIKKYKSEIGKSIEDNIYIIHKDMEANEKTFNDEISMIREKIRYLEEKTKEVEDLERNRSLHESLSENMNESMNDLLEE